MQGSATVLAHAAFRGDCVTGVTRTWRAGQHTTPHAPTRGRVGVHEGALGGARELNIAKLRTHAVHTSVFICVC
jgi:hypothetical protein